MAIFQLHVNGRMHTVDVDPNMPLLWAIRDVLGMHGTKFGCGVAQCGACTVHLNGKAARSCAIPVGVAALSEITTIEGLAPSDKELHPCQQAWIDLGVPQCGYCQPGQIMTASALIDRYRQEKRTLTDKDIDDAMRGNICRCGTYPRIRQAIHQAAEAMKS